MNIYVYIYINLFLYVENVYSEENTLGCLDTLIAERAAFFLNTLLDFLNFEPSLTEKHT